MGTTSGSNINNIVNDSGLSTPGSLTATHINTLIGNSWISTSANTTGNITFNLNGLYSLAGFSVWNLRSNTASGGVNGVNIFTSTDGTTFTSLVGAPTQFANRTTAPIPPQQFSFTPVDAAYVRFQLLSRYSGNLVGLAEVKFDGTPASATGVPEPLTILGTLAGLGGGMALKRQLRGVKSKSV
jgi:hypothetical protein